LAIGNFTIIKVYASIQSVSNRVKKSFEGKPYEYHVWSHDIPGDMRDDDECQEGKKKEKKEKKEKIWWNPNSINFKVFK